MITVIHLSPLTNQINALDLNASVEQFEKWCFDGVLIQRAFPQLSDDEREFILSGFLPGEFEAFIGSEEKPIEEQLAALQKENDLLRFIIAASNLPCIYCKLDAHDIAKCEHGFPGCSRADDLLASGDYLPNEEVNKT